jgi:uncharacterized protein DUF3309
VSTSFDGQVRPRDIVVLILLLVGATPRWPHSRNWGYGPSGVLGVLLIVVLVMALLERTPI